MGHLLKADKNGTLDKLRELHTARIRDHHVFRAVDDEHGAGHGFPQLPEGVRTYVVANSIRHLDQLSKVRSLLYGQLR